MNERIRELQKQAFDFVAKQNMCKKEYFWENIRHNRELQDSVDAKFAELIVRECADVLVAEMNRLDGLDRVVASQTMDTAQVLIKQHFGVEQ